MYYFHLYDDEKVSDTDGTDLVDLAAARKHATDVAHELTANSTSFLDHSWALWTMRVHNDRGVELFSLAMSDFRAGNSGK